MKICPGCRAQISVDQFSCEMCGPGKSLTEACESLQSQVSEGVRNIQASYEALKPEDKTVCARLDRGLPPAARISPEHLIKMARCIGFAVNDERVSSDISGDLFAAGRYVFALERACELLGAELFERRANGIYIRGITTESRTNADAIAKAYVKENTNDL